MIANRPLWLVSTTLFLSMVGFGITLPALPFFVERLALGPDPAPAQITFHVGMLTAAYALSQVLLGPLLGRWSDREGRKPLLLFGLIGFAVSQAVFGLGTSLPVLYGARLVAGAAGAALLTGSSAVVADVLPDEDRARGLAWTGTAASLGVVVGPTMSGILARGDMHGHRMVGRLMLDGFSIPFLVAGGLALVAIPMIALFLSETVGRSGPNETESPTGVPMLDLLILTGLSQLVLSSFEAIFALYGASVLGWSMSQIGWGFAVCGGVMTLQGVIVGLLSGRVTRHVQVAAGFSVLGVGTLLLGVTESRAGVLGAIAVLALGMSLIAPNLAAEVARRRPQALGSALGLQNTAGGVGRVIGPSVGALLFAVRPRLPFQLMAVLALVVAISIRLRLRHEGARR